MDSAGQAVIVFHRPANYSFDGSRSFTVWIDGLWAGKVKCGVVGEFAVEPGEHTVAVSMDWLRSRPLQILAGPGSRTELVIGARLGMYLKMFLPVLLAALVAPLAPPAVADTNWWLRWLLFMVVYVALFGGYVLVTSKFFGDYWAVWTLGPAGTSSSRAPVGGLPTVAAAGAGITAFRGMKSLQPAPLLNGVVRPFESDLCLICSQTSLRYCGRNWRKKPRVHFLG
jgi:hypothetical protein